MAKKDKAAVDYRAGEVCFHCQSFARPTEAGAILGHCSRVLGSVHPGSVCNLFEFGTEDDDDGDGRPSAQEFENRIGV